MLASYYLYFINIIKLNFYQNYAIMIIEHYYN
jgi:hypothetical protein